jgi:hypothetical protein
MKYKIIKPVEVEFKPFELNLQVENLIDAQKLIMLFSINQCDNKLMDELKYQLECMGYDVNKMYKK